MSSAPAPNHRHIQVILRRQNLDLRVMADAVARAHRCQLDDLSAYVIAPGEKVVPENAGVAWSVCAHEVGTVRWGEAGCAR